MRGSRKIGRRFLAVSTIVVGIGFVSTQFTDAAKTLASASFDMSDGDLVDSAADTDDDWEGLANGDCGDSTKRVECKRDLDTGRNDNSFGNGTKEDTPVPSIVTGSIPNNKSDLIYFYASSEVSTVSGNSILYIAWERVQDPSGATNMDFEFNRNQAAAGSVPTRSHGDLLVSYDLPSGSTQPTVVYRWWIASTAENVAPYNFGSCQAAVAPPCWSTKRDLATGQFDGAVNTTSIIDPIRTAKEGSTVSLSPRTFGEAAIDLTASGILPAEGACTTLGSVYLKSRSSDSFSAAVKDFILPIDVNISNCGKLTVTKTDDGVPTPEKLASVEFKLYRDDGAGSPGTFDPRTDANPTGDSYANISCTTGNGTGGTTLGECTMTGIPWTTYWLVETAAPTGYTAAVPTTVTFSQGNTIQTRTVVNARILGSVTINKTDDALTAIKVAGATFGLFVDTNSNGTYDSGTDLAVSGKTCTTAAVTGQCVISGVPWGTYFLVETGPPTGYNAAAAIPVTITKDVRDITQAVTNVAVFKVITLVCDTRDNQLVAGSVNYGSGALPTATAVGSLTDSDICAATLTGTLTTTRGTTLDPSGIAPPA